MLARFLVAVGLTAATAAPSFAQTWTIDPNHSNATFAVRHMMVSTVRGEFAKLGGTVDFDSNDPSKTAIQATIDATTISTRVADRDTHLKSADFLEVDKYPTITFRSKRAQSGADGLAIVGDLTIRGVTKEVTLKVDGPTPAIRDDRGNLKLGATATTSIDRREFGLMWNRALDAGGLVVGNDVQITIDVELTRKAEGAN